MGGLAGRPPQCVWGTGGVLRGKGERGGGAGGLRCMSCRAFGGNALCK